MGRWIVLRARAGGRGGLATLAMAATIFLAVLLVAGPAQVATTDGLPPIPDNAQFVPLEALQVPMTSLGRSGQIQAVLVMQLAVEPRADTGRIRSLMPRFRDALIRDFYAYPISQTGDFSATVLPSVTRRVMALAEAVYGKDVAVGVLFSNVMKIGC